MQSAQAPPTPHASSAVPGAHLPALQQPPLHASVSEHAAPHVPLALHASPDGQSVGTVHGMEVAELPELAASEVAELLSSGPLVPVATPLEAPVSLVLLVMVDASVLARVAPLALIVLLSRVEPLVALEVGEDESLVPDTAELRPALTLEVAADLAELDPAEKVDSLALPLTELLEPAPLWPRELSATDPAVDVAPLAWLPRLSPLPPRR